MRNIYAGIAIVLAITLAGCDSQPVKVAKADITKRLKDPRSAEYRNVKAVEYDPGEFLISGMVNAKNSFGGFTGFQEFRVTMRKTDGGYEVTSTFINDQIAD